MIKAKMDIHTWIPTRLISLGHSPQPGEPVETLRSPNHGKAGETGRQTTGAKKTNHFPHTANTDGLNHQEINNANDEFSQNSLVGSCSTPFKRTSTDPCLSSHGDYHENTSGLLPLSSSLFGWLPNTDTDSGGRLVVVSLSSTIVSYRRKAEGEKDQAD